MKEQTRNTEAQINEEEVGKVPEKVAQAGGSVRDDHVIMTCDKYGIAMAFTGVRLFHH